MGLRKRVKIDDRSWSRIYPQELMQSLLISAALNASWEKDTSYPDDANRWTEDEPSIGQCAVTSLVVQKYTGGTIHRNSKFKHYWNQLPSGAFVDFTRDQFKTKEQIESEGTVKRKDLLKGYKANSAMTEKRYRILLNRVESQINSLRPTLFLFSSNAQAEYIQDIVETIGSPNGTTHHFRYMLRYIDPALRELIPVQNENTHQHLIGAEVIISYLNQKSMSKGTYNWNASFPVRMGIIRECYKTGTADNSVAHFYFEVRENILEANSFNQKLPEIFGELFEKAYALLTFEDTAKLIVKHPGSKIFEIQCERLKSIGLTYETDKEKIDYEPPLMIFIEGIFDKQGDLVEQKYDSFSCKTYYQLTEATSYFFKFRTYNWDYKKPYEITLRVSKQLFCTPEEYVLPVNSSYDSECWELTTAFIQQSTNGYIRLEAKAKDHNSKNQIASRELNWCTFSMFELKRKLSLRILDTLGESLFVMGPIYLTASKMAESQPTTAHWFSNWPIVVGIIYSSWFIVKMIRRWIGGV